VLRAIERLIVITNSGKQIQIAERRYCEKCKMVFDQICHKIRYEDNPEQEGTLLKKSYWICSTCVSETEELKVQPIPGDKIRIVNRLLRMQDDYAITSMKIASQPERLVVEITVKD
jgi:hypothetical protein